jgi:hypothetical protein
MSLKEDSDESLPQKDALSSGRRDLKMELPRDTSREI